MCMKLLAASLACYCSTMPHGVEHSAAGSSRSTSDALQQGLPRSLVHAGKHHWPTQHSYAAGALVI